MKGKDVIDSIESYLNYRIEVFGNKFYSDTKIDTEPFNYSEAAKPEYKEIRKDYLSTEDNSLMASIKPTTVNPNWRDAKSLTELNDMIKECKECQLGERRTNFVFGVGNPNADVMIIGEAPGRDEDLKGEPFVGRAGQLLNKILESVGFSREEVYIANIIKSRPPENRRPQKDEVAKCKPYLLKQIELIKPKFMISLGLTSIDSLLDKSHKMAEIRGKFMDFHGIRLMVTYHPAALLRNPNWKKPVWIDMQNFRKEYDEYIKSRENK